MAGVVVENATPAAWFTQPSWPPSCLPTFLEPSFEVQHPLCARHEAVEVNDKVCDFQEPQYPFSTRHLPSEAVTMLTLLWLRHFFLRGSRKYGAGLGFGILATILPGGILGTGSPVWWLRAL